MIEIPTELDILHEYWPPELGHVYWVKSEIFPLPDPKPLRPYAVIALPSENRPNDLQVVRRSTTDRRGPFDAAQPEYGLDAGWFCELRSVSTALWTPGTVQSTGHVLTEEDLAWLIGVYL